MTRSCAQYFFAFTLALFIGLIFFHDPVFAETEESAFAAVVGPFSDWLSNLVFTKITIAGTEIEAIVIWMALPMILLTFYFGFINLRGFRQAFRIIRGRYRDMTAPGEVSQFQALSTALSGTVGIGNIAGVGLAIGWGGPGATFWMIIIGLFAMTVKFTECTLGVKYREVHEDGTISGGPMYYLKKGLANRGYVRLGILLSGLYALAGIPTIIQWATVNQMYSQVNTVTGIGEPFWFGVGLAILVAAVIIGGIRNIARVTSKLVPLMVFIYLFAAIVVIGGNITHIPEAILTIIEMAFDPVALEGSILGVIVIGMKRAVYSTEAGLGTSSMVHAAARTREPVSEGMVGLLEPFIDTVFVSTITALVIVLSGVYADPDLVGVDLTSRAFETNLTWFPFILMIAVFLFGFSTIISWGYYTEKIWTFVLGETKTSIMVFKLVFCALLIPGAILTTGQVFGIIDSLFFILAIPNIIGLYIMAPEIKADLNSYLKRLKSGQIKETVEAD